MKEYQALRRRDEAKLEEVRKLHDRRRKCANGESSNNKEELLC
jgi:hypothetical protein